MKKRNITLAISILLAIIAPIFKLYADPIEISFDETLKEYPDEYAAMQRVLYLANCKPLESYVITFSKREYNLKKSPKSSYFINAKHLNNVTLDGGEEGVTFHLDSYNGFALIQNCTDFALKNFNVTFNRVPFTQGYVDSIDAKNGSFVFRVDNEYPFPPDDDWVKENFGEYGWLLGVMTSTVSKEVKKGENDTIFIKKVEPTQKQGFYRVYVGDKSLDILPKLVVFDRFAMPMPIERNSKFDATWIQELPKPPAEPQLDLSVVKVIESEKILIENVCVSRARMDAFCIEDNLGIVRLFNCKVTIPQMSKDSISAFRDAFIVRNNKVGSELLFCEISDVLGDAIAIESSATMITKQGEKPRTYILTPRNNLTSDAKIRVYDSANASDIDWVRIIEKQGDEITTDRAITNLVTGNLTPFVDSKATKIFNMDYANKNFVVSGNKISRVRQTGIRAQGLEGVISSNNIFDIGKHAIEISNKSGLEYSGVLADKVVVSENKIGNTGASAIYVGTDESIDLPKERPTLKNFVKIEKNVFDKQTKSCIVNRDFTISANGNILVDSAGNITELKQAPTLKKED